MNFSWCVITFDHLWCGREGQILHVLSTRFSLTFSRLEPILKAFSFVTVFWNPSRELSWEFAFLRTSRESCWHEDSYGTTHDLQGLQHAYSSFRFRVFPFGKGIAFPVRKIARPFPKIPRWTGETVPPSIRIPLLGGRCTNTVGFFFTRRGCNGIQKKRKEKRIP